MVNSARVNIFHRVGWNNYPCETLAQGSDIMYIYNDYNLIQCRNQLNIYMYLQ